LSFKTLLPPREQNSSIDHKSQPRFLNDLWAPSIRDVVLFKILGRMPLWEKSDSSPGPLYWFSVHGLILQV